MQNVLGNGRERKGDMRAIRRSRIDDRFLPAGPRQRSDSVPGPGPSAGGSACGGGPGAGGPMQLSPRNSQACRQRSQGSPRPAHGTGHRQGNRHPTMLCLASAFHAPLKIFASVSRQ